MKDTVLKEKERQMFEDAAKLYNPRLNSDVKINDAVITLNKIEKENVIMNNTNKDYEEMFTKARLDSNTEAIRDVLLGVSTKKMIGYYCEGEDTAYIFPHYLIHSKKHMIQCDNTDTLIDITAITSYNENVTVLIKRSDLNTPGFKNFLNNRLTASLNCINKMKIKNSEDTERYTCYRELRTLVDFINKYIKELHWMTKSGEIALIHTIDEGYKRFAVIEFYDEGECEYKENPLYEDDKLYKDERFKEFVDKSNDGRKCYSLSYIEDVINMLESDDDIDKKILAKKWKLALTNLTRAFNRKRKEGWTIQNVWKSNYGKAINMLIDFVGTNNTLIKELTDEYAQFSIKVTDDRKLRLTFKSESEEGEELNYMTQSSQDVCNPGDEITVSHQGF